MSAESGDVSDRRPDYVLPHGRDVWPSLVEAVSGPVPTNYDEVVRLIVRVTTAACADTRAGRFDPDGDEPMPRLPGLEAAVAMVDGYFEAKLGGDAPSFFGSVLGDMLGAVRELPAAMGGVTALPALAQESNGGFAIPRSGARSLLAAAFLGMCEDYTTMHAGVVGRGSGWTGGRFGDISFLGIMAGSGDGVGAQRVACMLAYFYATMGVELDGEIVFERRGLSEPDTPDWAASTVPISAVAVEVTHDVKIEDVDAAGKHINFANKNLHIGCIIPSCTQEEVLFSIRPELFVGLLCCETLLPHETLITRGAVKVSKYSGYLFSFRWRGVTAAASLPDPDPTEIIAMDAMVVTSQASQFSDASLARDLGKAFVGFRGGSSPAAAHPQFPDWTHNSVSTGKWGCGVFNGDLILKFCQQLMAAAEAGVSTVYYSTFQRVGEAEAHVQVLDALVAASATVGDLYALFQQRYTQLRSLPRGTRAESMHAFVLRKLAAPEPLVMAASEPTAASEP